MSAAQLPFIPAPRWKAFASSLKAECLTAVDVEIEGVPMVAFGDFREKGQILDAEFDVKKVKVKGVDILPAVERLEGGVFLDIVAKEALAVLEYQYEAEQADGRFE